MKDSGQQTLQNFDIICASNCLTSWNEFPVDNSFAIGECNEDKTENVNFKLEFYVYLLLIENISLTENFLNIQN